MIRILLCPLIVLLFFGSVLAGDSTGTKTVDYFAPQNILRFADYLFEQGDYLRAAGEYRRYLFTSGDSVGADEIYYRMVKAFLRGGEYERSLGLLGAFDKQYPASNHLANLSLYRAVVAYHRKNFEQSLSQAVADNRGDPVLRKKIVAADYINLRDYPRAQSIACLTPEPVFRNDVCDKLESASSLPFKSKFLAGTLSAVIPGSGKIYCKRTGDGVYSLILVGLTAWQAYDGFEKDGTESVKGWVFGSLGAFFYLGNIYGSVIAAELYNNRVHHDFVTGLQIDITLP